MAAMAGIPALALRPGAVDSLTIMHTNDTHSRLDPYPINDPNYPGMGGYARRATLVRRLREQDPNLLLLDAGDIFQGTPYFNMYGGEPELKLMSKMGYDAAAFGNHEFDNGMDGFARVSPYANFPFLAANYDFSRTILADKVGDYKVIRKGGRKVGIYGIGINPQGLVSKNLYEGMVFLDPIAKAREMESKLITMDCDLIICLSHLGLYYQDERPSDVMLARYTRYTDIIVGGHTHNLLDPPRREENMDGRTVTIGQAGYGGTYAGIMQVRFNGENNFVEPYTTKV